MTPPHNASDHVAPRDKMEGPADAALAGREAKLVAVRKARRQDRALTGVEEAAIP